MPGRFRQGPLFPSSHCPGLTSRVCCVRKCADGPIPTIDASVPCAMTVLHAC